MSEECIFCRIIAGEIPARIVHQDDEVVAFRDSNPQAPTHVLVVPRRHLPTLLDAAPGDAALLGRLQLVATEIARNEGHDENGGFRLVTNCLAGAGQSVFHLHVHLLGGRPFSWPPG